MRLVQLEHKSRGRAVAGVEEPDLRLLTDHRTVYDLALYAIERGVSLDEAAASARGSERIAYDPVYAGVSEWDLLPPLDHPAEPHNCLISGTGLTHLASARNRQAMHADDAGEEEPVTDSLKMFQWGLEAGKPSAGKAGIQPEWFYKGTGHVLRGPNQPLDVPPFADDGGEEPEIAGLYVIGPEGAPSRLGFCIGNEFSDHVMEKKNYLYLAPSKLREASIGPELCTGSLPENVRGEVRVERGTETVWSSAIASGEANMSHSLANLEHHHFKYPQHRVPGQVHIHFFGADAFSFGAGIRLQDGDMMMVSWENLGRPLRNPLSIEEPSDAFVQVREL